MGAAIDALRPAVAATGRNPAFLSAAVVTLAVSGGSSLAIGRVPVVGEVVNAVLVTPALAALLVGMAAAGLATDGATLGDGVESLRSSYLSIAGAYAVLVAGVLVVVVVWAVEVTVAVAVGSGLDLADGPAAAGRTSLLPAADPSVGSVTLSPLGPETAVSIIVLTALALAFALVGGLGIQFFDVAIVVGGESALSSFGASLRLFREAPASVVGYSALRMLPIAGAGVAVAAGYRVGASLAGPTAGVLVALPVVAVVGPVTFTFVTAYHLAYYDERVGNRDDGDTDPVCVDGDGASSPDDDQVRPRRTRRGIGQPALRTGPSTLGSERLGRPPDDGDDGPDDS